MVTEQSSNPSSLRGHLIVRSHAPLPRFVCVVPVPLPDSSLAQLRNTILAILTGQVSATSSEQIAAAAAKDEQTAAVKRAAATTAKGVATVADSGLSYSEYLKQQTVHEWRLKSVVLELNQNALIAPETRNQMEEREAVSFDDPNREKGFVLLDDHECALLEHGDEINVWLKEGQEVDSLRLPKLAAKHVFGLPNQPKLTRSGTILGLPPAYSERANDQGVVFKAPQARLLEPAEPSSHSSSVSAHPDGQFETNMRHRSAPAGWHRILVVKNGGGQSQDKADGHELAPPLKNGVKRAKPKRLMSEGSNALIDQVPSKPAPPVRHNSVGITSLHTRKEDVTATSPPPSSPPLLTSNKELVASQMSVAPSGPSKAERQEREKVRKAGQRSMPSQALIIGPGVQGKVGRVNSMDGRKSNGAVSNGTQDAGEGETGHKTSGDYGNMDAFVSFTAASSEVHQMRQHSASNGGSGVRRMSNRSSTSERIPSLGMTATPNDQTRRSGDERAALDGKPNAAVTAAAAAAVAESTSKKGKVRQQPVERFVKLTEKPEIPPIRNLAPFADGSDEVETLMPMPMPMVQSPSQPSTSTSSVDRIPSPESTMSERELQLANDAAIAQALSESLTLTPSSERRPSMAKKSSSAESKTQLVRRLTGEPVNLNDSPGTLPFTATAPPALRTSRSTSSSPLLSRRSSESPSQLAKKEQTTTPVSTTTTKAERRFNEVKRSLEAEKERQAEQERARREKARKVSEEKVKTMEKVEQERRQKEEKMRWQVWDEVRLRQAKEQAR